MLDLQSKNDFFLLQEIFIKIYMTRLILSDCWQQEMVRRGRSLVQFLAGIKSLRK